jgi:hypothetical protein
MNLTQTTSFYCTESFDEKIEFQKNLKKPLNTIHKNNNFAQNSDSAPTYSTLP